MPMLQHVDILSSCCTFQGESTAKISSYARKKWLCGAILGTKNASALLSVFEWFENSRHWVFSGGAIAIGLSLLAYLARIRHLRNGETGPFSHGLFIKRERASHPCLKWAGSSTNHVELTHDFQNEGGAVSDLSVKTQLPIVAVIEPKDKLPNQMTGSIRFKAKEGKLAFPIKFELRYTTELNKPGKQGFWLAAAHRLPERLR